MCGEAQKEGNKLSLILEDSQPTSSLLHVLGNSYTDVKMITSVRVGLKLGGDHVPSVHVQVLWSLSGTRAAM